MVCDDLIGQAEEEEKEGDDETSGFVDVTAPHPEFVLSPPNARVSSREFEDICEDLAPANGRGELKNAQHPFLRALRRGVLDLFPCCCTVLYCAVLPSWY